MEDFTFKDTNFIKSIANIQESNGLEKIPTVAFFGRSNAGKSSLINAITNRKSLAKVSRTPGKTRLLNVFSTPYGFQWVDLPGFGYSKANHKEHKEMMALLEKFMNGWPGLKCLVILCDAQRPFPAEETQVLVTAIHKKITPVVVRTKIDRLNQSGLFACRKEMESLMGELESTFPVYFSSVTTGKGMKDILEFLKTKMGIN